MRRLVPRRLSGFRSGASVDGKRPRRPRAGLYDCRMRMDADKADQADDSVVRNSSRVNRNCLWKPPSGSYDVRGPVPRLVADRRCFKGPSTPLLFRRNPPNPLIRAHPRQKRRTDRPEVVGSRTGQPEAVEVRRKSWSLPRRHEPCARSIAGVERQRVAADIVSVRALQRLHEALLLPRACWLDARHLRAA